MHTTLFGILHPIRDKVQTLHQDIGELQHIFRFEMALRPRLGEMLTS